MPIAHAFQSFVQLRRAAFARAVRLGSGMAILVIGTLGLAAPAMAADALRVGSKRFTESYILAELLAQVARPHAAVEVKPGLGNTAIVYEALRAGSIDVYPEYTGTIDLEILKNTQPSSLQAMREQLKPLGLGVDIRLGFNDGYALAMKRDVAQKLGIQKLSDLARHPALRLGLSNEFIGRADGWKGLAQRYKLTQQPQGLDHGLAYDAVGGGQVDVIDIYTTDAKIDHLGLQVLQDDAGHFPRYDAVLLYRLDVPLRFAAAWAALQGLSGSISEPAMIAMNARAELQSVAFDVIARDHLAATASAAAAQPAVVGAAAASASAAASGTASAGPAVALSAPNAPAGFWSALWNRFWGADLARLTWQHLGLVFGSVGFAVLIGVPLAAWVAPHAGARDALLGLTGVVQTIPSLAMLAVLISAVGAIGTLPALIALTLYALLPIMRNTCTGLAEVPAGLHDAAKSLGLTAWQRMRLIDLPLAMPLILAGVRTATTIAVGTATIAAFIGAGGYGERIVTGLALNDKALMLAGALPSAAMALLFEAGFAWVQQRLNRGRTR